jgi:hypothetical protein
VASVETHRRVPTVEQLIALPWILAALTGSDVRAAVHTTVAIEATTPPSSTSGRTADSGQTVRAPRRS